MNYRSAAASEPHPDSHERGAEITVLGCGGMAPVADLVRDRLDVPVVEPLSAGLKALEMLIDLNHSQAGACVLPRAR